MSAPRPLTESEERKFPQTKTGRLLVVQGVLGPSFLVIPWIVAIENEALDAEREKVRSAELSRDQQERFKWAANARAEGLADLARLLISGWDNGFPVEDDNWERDIVERFRAALAETEPQ